MPRTTENNEPISHECLRFHILLYFFQKAVPSVMCGTFKNFTHESNLWISNGGTRSVIHYDADHNLHCMIAGRKDFMMVENKYSEDLYFGPKVWLIFLS